MLPLLAFVCILLATLAWLVVHFVSELLIRPPHYAHRRPEEGLALKGNPIDPAWLPFINDPLVDFGIPFESVEFHTHANAEVHPYHRFGGDQHEVAAGDGDSNDIVLRGWHVPAPKSSSTSSAPLKLNIGVITVHGAGRDRREFLRHLPFLHKAGFAVLLFDYREHGISSGSGRGIRYALDEHLDVLSAAAYARRQLKWDRIILLGASNGATSSILAAAHDVSNLIDAVIAESPYLSPTEAMWDSLENALHGAAWLWPFKKKPTDMIQTPDIENCENHYIVGTSSDNNSSSSSNVDHKKETAENQLQKEGGNPSQGRAKKTDPHSDKKDDENSVGFAPSFIWQIPLRFLMRTLSSLILFTAHLKLETLHGRERRWRRLRRSSATPVTATSKSSSSSSSSSLFSLPLFPSSSFPWNLSNGKKLKEDPLEIVPVSNNNDMIDNQDLSPRLHMLLRWLHETPTSTSFVHDLPEWTCRGVICSLTKPLLLMHGTHDTRLTLRHSVELFKHAKGSKELYIAKGAVHTEVFDADPVEYERRCIQFIRKHVPGV